MFVYHAVWGFGVVAAFASVVVWKCGQLATHGKNGAVAGKGRDIQSAVEGERNRLLARESVADDDEELEGPRSLAGTV